MIDEIPVLAVAAAFAEGVTEFRDAGELRVKESDRIATVGELLTRLGVGVESGADHLVVRGGKPTPAALESHGDHRIAMAGAVAANALEGETRRARLASGGELVPGVHPRPRHPHREARTVSPGAHVIAIDGPAGSGKSTVARGVAAALGLPTLDTGAMYRAVALAALEAGVDLGDGDAVAAVASAARHRRSSDGVIELDGRDVSDGDPGAARHRRGVAGVVASRRCARCSSTVSGRGWRQHGGGVVEGRDIGTVVLPDAPVKVFITARDDIRAARRQRDEAARGARVERRRRPRGARPPGPGRRDARSRHPARGRRRRRRRHRHQRRRRRRRDRRGRRPGRAGLRA